VSTVNGAFMTVGSKKPEILQDDIAEVVLEQVRGLVPTGLHCDLHLDSSLHEVGLDSLAIMDVLNRIEAAFGIRFSEESLYDIETCRDLVECVMQKTAAPATEMPSAMLGSSKARAAAPTIKKILSEYSDVRQFPECLAFQQRLNDTAAAGLVNPFFRSKQGVRQATATIGGSQVVSYTSFDYLGLSGHPKVTQAALEAIHKFGTSASASRLVGGDSTILTELDTEIARFLGTEAAVVFPSGYGTNASILGHLFGLDDLILYDELAHNSIVQGTLSSKARRRAFPHNDFDFVDHLLGDIRGQHRRVVVAIEGVYSMDGDYPDLPHCLDVKRRHQALLYVDEAHSIGVMGATGRGICEYFGVDPADGDLWMGTISKALASGGGYIAGRKILIQYLKYTTPALVYATASSPANSAAALAAIRSIEEEPERLARLRDNACLFLKLAHDCGMDTGNSDDTPIIPIILGSSSRCLEVSHQLLARGIDAQPILYPAVPEAAARIRFFITANHTEEQITRTVEVLAECIANSSNSI
jgi:8-amino-7-oxononanoate synthase